MIHLDYTYCLKRKNPSGVSEEELAQTISRLEILNEKLHENPYPFMRLPFEKYELYEMKQKADEIKNGQIEDILLLGIGGSALGAYAIFNALLSPYHNYLKKPRYWILDNIDPLTIKTVAELLNKEKTILIVISKSGETPETLTQFMFFFKLLEDLPDLKNRIVVITDKKRGSLKRIADEERLFTLSVPEDVGGRFSVLSPVGMFPSLLLGLDVESILLGAKKMAEHIKGSNGEKNIGLLLCALLYLMDKKGKKIHVMMPYCDRLYGFSEWFRQLEAESLGKDGKGPTPLLARGVTDQHSQLQLYVGGPKDKFLIFIFAPSIDLPIPMSFPYVDELNYLSGRTFGQLFLSEFKATKLSASEAGVPVLEIDLDNVSCETIGALFYLFEMAIVLFGELLGINPFDQPGVEKGKIYTKAFMGSPSYSDLLSQLKAQEGLEEFKVSF
ncbi:MAG: glucose-6-phosphate isomerase [Desulfobacterota bacterium]|nr:glucose-6-phosphate isomerase [Thermodesulfobacteriota bacterium]MDW8002083.1 glucose-6-phosphate isomerase [Deltaproteobacteria bacterium]